MTRGAETIDLAPKEFGILEYMMRNRGRPLSRTMIVEHVWDMDYDGLTNIVDVYIRHLRSKIDDQLPAEADPDRARHRVHDRSAREAGRNVPPSSPPNGRCDVSRKRDLRRIYARTALPPDGQLRALLRRPAPDRRDRCSASAWNACRPRKFRTASSSNGPR